MEQMRTMTLEGNQVQKLFCIREEGAFILIWTGSAFCVTGGEEREAQDWIWECVRVWPCLGKDPHVSLVCLSLCFPERQFGASLSLSQGPLLCSPHRHHVATLLDTLLVKACCRGLSVNVLSLVLRLIWRYGSQDKFICLTKVK